MANEEQEEIREVERINQPAEQFVDRTLQTINGGGTITLVAFMGQTWANNLDVRAIILASITIMALGLASITLSSMLRLRSMDRVLKQRPKQSLQKYIYRYQVYIALRWVSFTLFLVSLGQLVVRLSFVS